MNRYYCTFLIQQSSSISKKYILGTDKNAYAWYNRLAGKATVRPSDEDEYRYGTGFREENEFDSFDFLSDEEG